jgi:protein-disulfide isomerase
MHDQANEAALAAHCASEQGKFWEYGDRLFAKQDEWANSQSESFFKAYAKGLGMNIGQFNICLGDKKYQPQIDGISKEASDFGISGTPAIFVDNQFKNGVVDANTLRDMIETELHK